VFSGLTDFSSGPVCSRRQVAALTAFAVLGVLIVSLVGSDPSVLCLLPILALAAPLLIRRYPGERLLLGFAQHRRSRWPRVRSSAPVARQVRVAAVRGGLLLARALAVRPPPDAVSPAS
jgi:hypothetical protein